MSISLNSFSLILNGNIKKKDMSLYTDNHTPNFRLTIIIIIMIIVVVVVVAFEQSSSRSRVWTVKSTGPEMVQP
jgi:hypothetical protein